LQHAELRESVTGAVLLVAGPLICQGTFKQLRIMFFIVPCKVFRYTSSALVEIMAEEADHQNKSVVEETQTLIGASMCSVPTD
jgi:hypothetical protein